ncbi:MAG: molybdate ABC transporter substrate-binding protein [Dehalococcoidia bacterium]
MRRGIARRALLMGATAFAIGAAVACGGDGKDDNPRRAATPDVATGEIIVFAASSLTDAFKEAGAAFERAHPGAKVTFNFAASSALATQINEGAPADLFVPADLVQLKVVMDAKNAFEAQMFVTNELVVVTPAKGGGVTSFADLARPGVRLVLAGKDVPAGRYARDVLTRASTLDGAVAPDFAAKVLANVRSEEANVRAVLTKVQLGEADAGIVYRTDANAAGKDVTVLEIPAAFNVQARYAITVTKAAKNVTTAEAFVEFLFEPQGQKILAKYGFGAP